VKDEYGDGSKPWTRDLGFLDAILYLEREQVENDLVEVFVLET
jgi:hypothetical protein